MSNSNQQIVPATEGRLTKREPPKTLGELVGAMSPVIKRCLPSHLNPERMTRVALTALRTTPHLAECSQTSFGAAILGAALLGLEPNTPLQYAWLIPFYSEKRRCYECQLMIGYQGYLELSRRSGQAHPIRADVVINGDEFDYELGLHPNLVHRPKMSLDRDDYPNLLYAYAICTLKDPTADPIIVVLNKKQIERRRLRGQNGPAWRTDPVEMAKKTAVRALAKWIPKSLDLALADALDSRHEAGRTPASLVATVIDQDATADLETAGVNLAFESDDPEEQAETREEQPAAQNPIEKAMASQAANSKSKRQAAPPPNPENDGR